MRPKDRLYQTIRFVKDNGRLIFQVFAIRMRSEFKTTQICHFLVVKNPIYARISLYAISSLLFFNPNVKVNIHCDKCCFRALNPMTRLLFGSRVTLIRSDTRHHDPMFEKAKLLVSLQGTSDFFIDADTRINGRLPVFSNIGLLVREFKLSESEVWRELLNRIQAKSLDGAMLNTTFFTWGNRDLNLSLQNFTDFYSKFMRLNWEAISLEFKIVDKQYLRLVEQFFFSIELSQQRVLFLKSEDSVADKGLIESSYYGASGYRFGR